MAGLTSAGLVPKTLDEIVADLEAAFVREFPGINTKAGVAHQLISIFAAKLRENWELIEAAVSATNPGSAEGVFLDRLAALTGTEREPARASRVVATVTLDGGATLPAGSQAHVNGDATAVFATETLVTNPGGSPADFDVAMVAIETGPVSAPSFSLTEIITPVVGWTAVTNADDAELGRNVETDAELRTRRQIELARPGGSTVDAIRADLLDVPTVLEAIVIENVTDAEVDGIPPHGIECVVRSVAGASDDKSIAEAIWASKPAGVATTGDDDELIEDSMGIEHLVSFTRPTVVELYLDVDVNVDPDVYPPDGDDQIKTAIAEWAQRSLRIGSDVIVSRFYCLVLAVPGVLDVTALRLGDAADPVSTTNWTIGTRELAEITSARIVVDATEV